MIAFLSALVACAAFPFLIGWFLVASGQQKYEVITILLALISGIVYANVRGYVG